MSYKNVNHYRRTVHLYLDPLWQVGKHPSKARSVMYRWLAIQMNLDPKETHVRYFTRDQCKQAIKILRPRYITLFGHDLPYKKKEKKGRKNMKIQITRHKEFEAAHLLPNHEGKCKNLHGHTYKWEVTIEGPQTEPFGMIMDFKHLDNAMNEIMPDHMYLYNSENPSDFEKDLVTVLEKYNSVKMGFPFATTAENMVKYLAELLEEYIHNELGLSEVNVVKSVLYETTNSYATYIKGE